MITELREPPSRPDPAACCPPLGSPSPTDEETVATAVSFKALADPNPVRIVNPLTTNREPACVCDLTGPQGMTRPTISPHLEELVTVRLLDREQRGTWAYHSLDHDTMRHFTEVVAPGTDLEGASR